MAPLAQGLLLASAALATTVGVRAFAPTARAPLRRLRVARSMPAGGGGDFAVPEEELEFMVLTDELAAGASASADGLVAPLVQCGASLSQGAACLEAAFASMDDTALASCPGDLAKGADSLAAAGQDLQGLAVPAAEPGAAARVEGVAFKLRAAASGMWAASEHVPFASGIEEAGEELDNLALELTMGLSFKEGPVAICVADAATHLASVGEGLVGEGEAMIGLGKEAPGSRLVDAAEHFVAAAEGLKECAKGL